MQAQEELIIMIKGKRSKRPARPSSPLALTMATTSCTTVDLGGPATSYLSGSSDHHHIITPSPSNSDTLTESTHHEEDDEEEEEDMANCLILLAKGQRQTPPPPEAAAPPEVYQCKTCSKSFASFQALGGHRASHKKPYSKSLTLDVHGKKPSKFHKHEGLSFQSNRDESTILTLQISNRVSSGPKNRLSRVHECSICGAEFASGQALGGHMRRHRAAATTSHGESHEAMKTTRNLLPLDLNLPAPEDDQRESKFSFATQELVFSTSSLVDCLY